MKKQFDKKFIRYFEYAGYKIALYPKRHTDKAMEFRLFDSKGNLTNETIWIPKSTIEINKDGNEYYNLDFIFKDYEQEEKLIKIGYWL